MNEMRVVVVDHHPLFRECLVQVLGGAAGIEVVAEGDSAENAVMLARNLAPDVLLLDVDAGIHGDGLAAARVVASLVPAIRVVLLAGSEEEQDLLAAMRTGARGYVVKGLSGRELIGILRCVWAGEVYIPPALATRVLAYMARSPSQGHSPAGEPDALTERERQILELASGREKRGVRPGTAQCQG